MNAFTNRETAGQELAETVKETLATPGAQQQDWLVLALPRGGVPVATKVSQALNAELDLMVVRKLGLPWHPELAMGAVASGGVRVLNEDVIQGSSIKEDSIKEVEEKELKELERREKKYRGDREHPTIEGRHVILVDDGIATGATMQAAIKAVRSQKPAELVVAIPVAPPETVTKLDKEADRVICLLKPSMFTAIGAWYQDFGQTSDEDVRILLSEAWRE